MAAPSGQLKASRYFAALLAIIALTYALVFLTGDKKPKPKLGLDLQGGTSMMLSATQPNGAAPPEASLKQARNIIADRVDTTGVAEPEVVIEGDRHIVVNVAGGMSESELRQLVAPAKLLFRKVLKETTDTAVPEASASASASASPSASGSAAAAAPASASPTATPAVSASASSGTAAASASGSASPSASASETQTPDASIEAKRKEIEKRLGQVYSLAVQLPEPDASQPLDQQYTQMLAPFGTLTPEEVAVLPAELQFKVPTISCKQLAGRPVGSIVDAKQKVVACNPGKGGVTKYYLDVAKVLGEDVDKADFTNDASQGGWMVKLGFKNSGQDKWTALTKEAYNNGAKEKVAITLDNEVVSAPSVEAVMTGDAQITGSFTKKQVQTLARQLKYGSLPLAFKPESVERITPTIGEQAMYSGLLAGAIGLALVIIYCLAYYRGLGLVVIASLLVSGAIVYGALVLLGRPNAMGFSLSLAGIAGFIVAIGITADSFVVYFERLKDEVKDGRTVRSAVPRAWVRARRTIISADMVSFLAALVLYILAVGPVKGFAFTLGMSTVFDLIVVFLFTHPLVSVLSRFSAFTSPRFSGLGNVRSDSEHTLGRAVPRLGGSRAKEA